MFHLRRYKRIVKSDIAKSLTLQREEIFFRYIKIFYEGGEEI